MSDSARPARMSTITDVAREAGVSVATVSRALRGLDRVSPETREKVLQVAEELNYMASPTATSLASGRTEIVGVVAPFLTRWFFASLVSAIEKSLRARGHHVLLFDLEDESYDSRLHLSQNLLWRRVDGVITLNLPMTDEELALLDRLALPAVAIGTPMPGHPCVRIDDADAMRQATEHLISQGHRRIAYIGAVPGNVAHVLTPRAVAGPSRRPWPPTAYLFERSGSSTATGPRMLRPSTPRPSSPVSRRPSDRRPSSRRPTRWPSVPWPLPIAWDCTSRMTSRSSASTITPCRMSSV